MTREEKIDILWQEREITKVILRFGRSIDTGDWAGYRSCFSNPVLIDFERLTHQAPALVDADLWTRCAEAFQTPLRRHHTYSNFSIDIDDDHARAVVYHSARHWRSTDNGVSYNNQYGWYHFDLERRDDAWVMTRVKHDFQWVDGNQGVVVGENSEFMALAQQAFSSENQEAARALLTR